MPVPVFKLPACPRWTPLCSLTDWLLDCRQPESLETSRIQHAAMLRAGSVPS